MYQSGFKIPFTIKIEQEGQHFIVGNVSELDQWDITKQKNQLYSVGKGLYHTTVHFNEVYRQEIEWKYFTIFEDQVLWQIGPNQIISSEDQEYFSQLQYRFDEIKIMSFNIRYKNGYDGVNHWDNRVKGCNKIIQFEQADFVGLQEATLQQKIDLLQQPYYSVGRGRDYHPDDGEAALIFYNKFIWILLWEQTFWLSDTPFEPSKCFTSNLNRIATTAIFANNYFPEFKILVVNTHFDLDSSCQKKSAEVLIEIVLELQKEHGINETIIMGDFNCKMNSQPMKSITGLLNMSQFQVDPRQTTFHNFEGKNYKHNEIIDHILYKGDLIPTSYRVITDQITQRIYPSDHYPIICVVKKV